MSALSPRQMRTQIGSIAIRPSTAWRTPFPRTMWTVVERDGQPELVIWRQWLGNAYDIVSLAGDWGRWDRQRLAVSDPGGNE